MTNENIITTPTDIVTFVKLRSTGEKYYFNS